MAKPNLLTGEDAKGGGPTALPFSQTLLMQLNDDRVIVERHRNTRRPRDSLDGGIPGVWAIHITAHRLTPAHADIEVRHRDRRVRHLVPDIPLIPDDDERGGAGALYQHAVHRR